MSLEKQAKKAGQDGWESMKSTRKQRTKQAAKKNALAEIQESIRQLEEVLNDSEQV